MYSLDSPAKNSTDCRILAIAYASAILRSEKAENSSFDIILIRDHLLVCLQLEKLLPFPKKNKRVYGCRAISLFFLCIASAEMSMSMTPQEVPPQEHSS